MCSNTDGRKSSLLREAKNSEIMNRKKLKQQMPSTRHLQNSRGVDERYAVAACSSLHYEAFMISDKGGYDFALSCLSVSRII